MVRCHISSRPGQMAHLTQEHNVMQQLYIYNILMSTSQKNNEMKLSLGMIIFHFADNWLLTL